MPQDSPKNQIAKLRAQIAEHERLYRIENAPVISDDDFDLLVRQLKELEAKYPQYADESSPSRIVGNDLSGAFVAVEHLSPMKSLDNVFNSSELEEFDSRLHKTLGLGGDFMYCVEPKIDGAGISAVYENGKLVRLLTRGDGTKGDDITRNAFVLRNLPMRLTGTNVPSLLEIRGEAYMTRAEFDRLSAAAISKNSEAQNSIPDNSRKSPYANPRNLAAGTLKLLDKNVLEQRNLQVIFYSFGAVEGFTLRRQSELAEILRNWGVPSFSWTKLAQGPHGAFERICELEEVRADFPYNTDGAVVKLDDCSLYPRAGMTSHAPRWAVAWKYRAERANTKLKSITLQVGRTGAVTPVAELEPVFISGTTVSRATLHNADNISEKDIRVGDTVVIEKAGEIIPAVLEVVKELRPQSAVPYEFPQNCPECGSRLVRYGAIYRCPNLSCPSQVRGRIAHFASRSCMDIQGLGISAVDKVVETLGVKDPADLYKLTLGDLLRLENFKEKSAGNLLSSIEASKNRELWRLIFALGILEIGEQFAKDLARKYGTLDALMEAPLEDLESNQGFGSRSKKKDADSSGGSVRALSIRAFFDDPNNRALIERLRAAGLNFGSKSPSNVSAGSLPLSGKIFVFTGTLQSMGRAKAKEIVESLGGRSASDVSKSTDFLVSDGKIDGSKAAKAREYGTRVLSENEFLKMVEDAREKLSFSADENGTSAESAIPGKRPSEILSTVEKSAQTRENTETDSNTNGRDNLQTGNFAASVGRKSVPSETQEKSEAHSFARSSKKLEDGKVSACDSDSQFGLELYSENRRAGQKKDSLHGCNIRESAPKKSGKHKNVPPECGQMSLGI